MSYLPLIHHYLRKVLPFLYIRNWYTGHFELSTARAAVFTLIVCLCAVALVTAYVLGQPITFNRAHL